MMVLGTLVYRAIDLADGSDLGWIDSFYMTVITLTTVGYGEIIPLDHSPRGRLFTAAFLLAGMGVLVYALSSATALLVEGQLARIVQERRMRKRIEELSGHHVVCGTGPIVERALDELIEIGHPVVWVCPAGTDPTLERGYHVQGDYDDEATLRRAGVDRATGMIVASESDRDNILATMTAHQVNPRMRIVAMAKETQTEEKLRRAGATEVVFPLAIGGLRLASSLVRPSVVTLIDTMLRGRDPVLRIEELIVPEHATGIGRTFGEVGLADVRNVILIAVIPAGDRAYVYKPDAGMRVEAGMTLCLMTDAPGLASVGRALGA
ncbi:MAG: potassium channel family protein [Alphaproteobacteria bacterium]